MLLPHRPRGRRAARGPARYRPALEALEDRCLPSNVLTYHNDVGRTGDNLAETVLTPADVNPTDFGKRFSVPVDGQVYAQPLYLEGVVVPGQGTHNVVFVATEHDSVYAIDADSGAVLWHDSFIDPAAGITTVSNVVVGAPIAPEVGITATPVIDPSTGTLYVLAALEAIRGGHAHFAWELYALDVHTGAEKGVVAVRATVPGTGDGGSTVTFQARQQLGRAALLLLNGVVYTSFTSYDDRTPVHGWLIGYRADNLRLAGVFNTSPDGQLATIWQSGAGPAADAAGDIYFLTGNGTFDANGGGPDYGDSLVKLSTRHGLRVVDSFTPASQAQLAADDLDLGSGGTLLLPDQPGAHPHLALGAGKQGRIYLVNRDHLGHLGGSGHGLLEQVPGIVGSFGMAAYFDAGPAGRWIYYAGAGDSLKAFLLVNGLLVPFPLSQSAEVLGYPGGTPSVSANGTSNGIVWVLDRTTPALRAYDALNLGHELYNSDMAGARDRLDPIARFVVPTVADGKVFVGTADSLTVYGELG